MIKPELEKVAQPQKVSLISSHLHRNEISYETNKKEFSIILNMG